MRSSRAPFRRRPIAFALRWVLAIGCGLAGASVAVGADATDPEPPGRPFTTDRPDRTESPYSVEPGVLQAELDVLSSTRTVEGPLRRDVTSLGVMNLKVGITRRLDLQLVVAPVVWDRREHRPTARVETATDFGDVTPRAKLNLWGNDGGATAGALLPYVLLSFDGDVEAVPGMLFPVAVALPWGIGAAVMGGIEGGDERASVLSATAGRSLFGPLAGFVELWASRGTVSDADWSRTLDVGLTYDVTPALRLDAGIYDGLEASVTERTLFLGVSARR